MAGSTNARRSAAHSIGGAGVPGSLAWLDGSFGQCWRRIGHQRGRKIGSVPPGLRFDETERQQSAGERRFSMAFRMRKSIKVAPGVRLNVSKTGVGASVGGKGARTSVHSSGRRTTTLVPGVYYQKSAGGGRSSQAATAEPAPSRKKPGLFAPKAEKKLYKAVRAQDFPAMKRVGN